ncbi:hypothetical protein ACIRD3_12205 [Kitasatospora sp. NPDC093550]|uniref:hypothetical protein n=1 Tax=Kitasatospora sp. NPDC093550 TaxID=3364089 RepID=UPI0037FEB470
MSRLRSRVAALAALTTIALGAVATGTANAAPVAPKAPAASPAAAPAVAAALSEPTHIPMNSVLNRNQAWYSPDRHIMLAMQGDGNVVVYRDTTPIWVAKGAIPRGNVLVMQGDGNLVVYAADNTPLWASNTDRNPGAELAVYNEGAIAVQLNGKVLWSSVQSAPTLPPCPPWGPPYPGQITYPWCPVWPFPS